MKRLIICVFFSFFMFACATIQDPWQSQLQKSDEQWEQFNGLAVKAYHDGQYQKGITFAQKAYQYALKQFGKEHPSTLATMNNLALLYESQGRYGEAEPLYKKALQLLEKVLSKEHPLTLTSTNNLALLYESQGRRFRSGSYPYVVTISLATPEPISTLSIRFDSGTY